MRGEMLWFNEVKSFGFIRTEDGERLYVHSSGFLPGQTPVGRCAGRLVSFERQAVEGDSRAIGVSFVPEVASRRARPRQGSRSLSSW